MLFCYFQMITTCYEVYQYGKSVYVLQEGRYIKVCEEKKEPIVDFCHVFLRTCSPVTARSISESPQLGLTQATMVLHREQYFVCSDGHSMYILIVTVDNNDYYNNIVIIHSTPNNRGHQSNKRNEGAGKQFLFITKQWCSHMVKKRLKLRTDADNTRFDRNYEEIQRKKED